MLRGGIINSLVITIVEIVMNHDLELEGIL